MEKEEMKHTTEVYTLSISMAAPHPKHRTKSIRPNSWPTKNPREKIWWCFNTTEASPEIFSDQQPEIRPKWTSRLNIWQEKQEHSSEIVIGPRNSVRQRAFWPCAEAQRLEKMYTLCIKHVPRCMSSTTKALIRHVVWILTKVLWFILFFVRRLCISARISHMYASNCQPVPWPAIDGR